MASFCNILLMRTFLNNENSAPLLLGNLRPGERAEIIGFSTPTEEAVDFLRRLFEVGFLVGAQVELLQQAPYSGDPISVRIKEATYALRRAEANLVQVSRL